MIVRWKVFKECDRKNKINISFAGSVRGGCEGVVDAVALCSTLVPGTAPTNVRC